MSDIDHTSKYPKLPLNTYTPDTHGALIDVEIKKTPNN
jgi:hypothetical protein